MTGALAKTLACAACVSSAYGDRSFNWAYTALMVVPFVILAVIGAVFAWNAGYRIRFVSGSPRGANAAQIRKSEETTTT